MSLKKKLGLGAASAALGLSLIGGGTFAYFNDTATVNNQFATGTLNLDVLKDGDSAINFDLRNMKPGDTAKRYFILQNRGSLSIKDVMLKVEASGFVDAKPGQTGSDMENFLKQFKVEFFRVQNPDTTQPNGPWNNPANTDIIQSGHAVTLWDLHNKDYSKIVGTYVGNGVNSLDNDRLNLSPTGLPVNDKDGVGIQITFENKNVSQNEFQGDSVKVAFNLEARQEAGVEVKTNGNIKSNENHPSSTLIVDPTGNIGDLTDSQDNPNE
jgi:spore coat-associated protein N